MKQIRESFWLSATDLVGYLNCRHLTSLDRAVANGSLEKPKVWDPLLEVLWERGSIHERKYVDHLIESGLDVVRVEGVDVTSSGISETLAAMKSGVQVIVQGALSHHVWSGRADVLLRVEHPSVFGNWSYEVVDTKLARETKAATVLQLCLYSYLLQETQGKMPEYMYVIAPWSAFEPQTFRFADYAAYFRMVSSGLLTTLDNQEAENSYPDPVEHCDICRWRDACDKRRRDDDHLCLVAGVSKVQINELNQRGIKTLQELARIPLPLDWKPERGSTDSFARIREQARIQIETREAGALKFELLPITSGLGLTRLPEPSKGDIFLDLEGDPFVGEHGLEYLFGCVFVDENGESEYQSNWALTRGDEKLVLENFVDFVLARWEVYPDLHIYHYAPYEPAALKRLMGRYATREEEIDRMLRAKLFVDLYQVVRQGIRAGVESYSIKRLEPLYGFKRQTALTDANIAIANFQANLELEDILSISDETKAVVCSYNKDDCNSTVSLQHWLEGLRMALIADGTDVPRPEPGDGTPNEKITDWLIKINGLIKQLISQIPDDLQDRDEEQQARWILANTLDWHRREAKAVWWELYRLADLSTEDLLDERAGLADLTYVGEAGGTVRAPIHRYRFPTQETELRGGEDLRNLGGDKLGKIDSISFDDNTVDIKKRGDSVSIHPRAVFAHKYVDAQILADSLVRIGEYVVQHGLRSKGPYQAARDLLLREAPRVGVQELQSDKETTVVAAVRLCKHVEGGILAIQGPPGAGKTFTGARMACELARLGKTVGITANSHKVIRNLIDETIAAADRDDIALSCCQKAGAVEEPQHRLSFARSNDDLFTALQNEAAVGGGTAWLWARPDAFEVLDVLFVDEAAQMSLANVLAVSQAAKTVVLIGDPQQLDQPMQGSHPDGTDVSALDYILAGEQTISPERGLFLGETWRLHPDICAYTSELFYDDKLKSKDGLEKQDFISSGPISGPGLYYLPVEHDGNQNCSPEEAQAVGILVNDILDSKATWVDRDGQQHPVTLEDIVIITPYNAQVFEIGQWLPGARIGTVDKFQGQEAPVAIYSIATSSHADAPRGMEFLYSLNRLNVATSRAKCVSVMVSSPRIFEAECRTPRQIKLANAFCRYLELAVRPTI